jgi:hypothetical protein
LKSNQGDKKVHLQAPLPLWCFIGKEQAILLPYFLPRKQHYAQEHQDGEEKWQYFREFQAPITDVQPRIRGCLAACCFNFLTAIKSKTSAVCFRRFNKFTKPRETETGK